MWRKFRCGEGNVFEAWRLQVGAGFLSVDKTTLRRGSRRPKAWPGPSLGGMVLRCGEGNVLEA